MSDSKNQTDVPVDRDIFLLEAYQEERAKLREQLKNYERTLKSLEQWLNDTRMQVYGLDQLITRTRERIKKREREAQAQPLARETEGLMEMSAATAEEDSLDQSNDDLLDLSRMDAVAYVLEHADEPLGPSAIQEALSDAGRNDDLRAVSAALDYLRRRNRAHREGRARWVAGPDPNDELDNLVIMDKATRDDVMRLAARAGAERGEAPATSIRD
jgi:hypothetical protein